MTYLFLAVIGLLIVAALALSKNPPADDSATWMGILMGLGAAVLPYAGSILLSLNEGPAILQGSVVAGVVVAAASILERLGRFHPLMALGLGAVGAYLVTLLSPAAGPAALVAAALAALVIGSPAASLTMLASGALVATSVLLQPSEKLGLPPFLLLGSVLTVLAFLATFVKKVSFAQPILVAAGVAGFGWWLAGHEGAPSFKILAAAGACAGLAISWLYQADTAEPKPGSQFVVALIWLGLGAAGFALGRSAGMALALVAGVGVPLAIGNTRAAVSCAPLAALVWYRLVRVAEPDFVKGTEMSQLYLLIGVLLGIAIAGLAWNWRQSAKGSFGEVGGVIWSVALVVLPVAVYVVFGQRGLTGLLLGSGLGGLFVVDHAKPVAVASVGAAIAGTTILVFNWVEKNGPGDREAKVKLLGLGMAGAAVIALLLFLLQLKRAAPAQEATA